MNAPRHRTRAWGLGALAALLALVLALGGFGAWLWHSEDGTRWTLQRVPGLQSQGVQGRLLGGPFAAQRLQWQGSGWRVVVEDLAWADSTWRWRPWPGAWFGVDLRAARARSVVATPLEDAAPAATREPPVSLTLPLALSAQGLRLDSLRVGEAAPATGITADLHLGAAQGREHRVQGLSLAWGGLSANGEASIATEGDMAVQARLGLASEPGAPRPWQARATLAGPLRRPSMNVTLNMPGAVPAVARAQAEAQAQNPTPTPTPAPTAPAQPPAGPDARAELSAVLAPFAPFPLAALNLRTESLDLSVLAPSLPQTRLSGHAVLQETQPGAPLAFQVQLDNALPGVWDAGRLPLRSARVLLNGRPDAPGTLSFDALQAELGGTRVAGRLQGNGRWQDGTLTLALQLDGLQPAALDTRAPALQLSGPLALTLRGLPAPGADTSSSAASPGLTGEFSVTMEGTSLQPRSPRATLGVRARFALPGDGSQQWAVEQLSLASGQARVLASADARLGADGAWQLATRGSSAGFDPGVWWPAAAARGNALNGRWQADLRGSGAPAAPGREPPAAAPLDTLLQTLRGEARFELSPSRIAGVPLQGSARLNATDEALALQAGLQAAGNRLDVEGNVGLAGRTPRWQLDVEAPALAALAPLSQLPALADVAAWMPRAGTLQAQARTEGRWPALSSRGSLRAAGVQTQALQLARADARWSFGGAGLDAPLALQVDASGLVQGQRRLDSLQLRADGTLRAHRLSLLASSPLRPPAWADRLPFPIGAGAVPVAANAANTGNPAVTAVTAPGTALRLALQGRWQPTTAPGTDVGSSGRWQGSFSELQAAPRQRPGAPWLSGAGLQLAVELAPEGQLRSATLAPGRVALFGGGVRWRQARWQGAAPGRAAAFALDAEVEPLQIAPMLAQLQPEFAWQGDLAVGARVQLTAADAFDADVVVTRQGGDLSLAYQGVRRALGIDELRLVLAAHEGHWQLSQAITARNVGVLGGGFSVRAAPGARWPAPGAAVDGGVSLRIDDLGVWAPWLPAGWRLGGQVQAVATVAGTVGEPQASGLITGSALELRNLFQGVHLRQGELALALRGSEAVIERLVFQDQDGGSLRGSGRASLAGAEPRAALQLQAERFRMLDRVDRRVTVSGSADLALQGERVSVAGRFRVDQGLIDVTQADAPRNEADVIVVNRPGAAAVAASTPGLLAQADVQVTVDLGEKLRLRGGGLDALLRGQLRVSTRADGGLNVAGVVRTAEGRYSAYGQNLVIARGELSFTGDVANPRLDVLALRPDLDTQRVGVAVTGLAVDPRVRLYSEPGLPDFETLAWLVLGREPGGLGRDDTALLQRAALALLAGGSGDGPGKGFVQRLGLDDLAFSAGSGGNLSEGIVSLGKQISRRLYVGYEHALAGAGGSWQLIYRVAGRFTLRLQAGQDQTLDGIWTWRWE